MSVADRAEQCADDIGQWLELLRLAREVVRSNEPDVTSLARLRIQVTKIERRSTDD